MATINPMGNGLFGTTGTVAFVGATSPTFVTPVIGAASATSLSFSSTTEVIGTTTNDNAATGSVGEYVESTVATGTTSFSNGTIRDLTSISLTAGDWDVWGNIYYTFTGDATIVESWVNNASASAVLGILLQQKNLTLSNVSQSAVCVPQRFSLSGTTTIYLSGVVFFSSGACTAGGIISARRVR